MDLQTLQTPPLEESQAYGLDHRRGNAIGRSRCAACARRPCLDIFPSGAPQPGWESSPGG